VRLFKCCLVFIDCYSDESVQSRNEAESLAIMAMRCHFVVAAALVSVARTTNEVDEQLHRYLEMGQHIAAFDQLLHATVGPQDEKTLRDLNLKFSSLLVFKFEGAVALKRWGDLRRIVNQVEVCQNEGAMKAMGDCLLRSQAPGESKYSG
jgi:hypothetical protein